MFCSLWFLSAPIVPKQLFSLHNNLYGEYSFLQEYISQCIEIPIAAWNPITEKFNAVDQKNSNDSFWNPWCFPFHRFSISISTPYFFSTCFCLFNYSIMFSIGVRRAIAQWILRVWRLQVRLAERTASAGLPRKLPRLQCYILWFDVRASPLKTFLF